MKKIRKPHGITMWVRWIVSPMCTNEVIKYDRRKVPAENPYFNSKRDQEASATKSAHWTCDSYDAQL